MNEQQPIFTPEQFRAQAVELSQAVAELQRRDSVRIDPHDPFSNETEFHSYQPDYAEIVPQIRIPGCSIPLRANDREKGRIRRYYNIVGGFLLGHLLLSNLIFIGLEMLALFLIRLTDQAAVAELPVNYDDIATEYFTNSSCLVAMNLLVFGLLNVLVFWLGCRATKITIPNLFRTKNFTVLHALGYISVIILIQFSMGYAATFISDLFEGVGITLYEPDISPLPEVKNTVVSAIYSILIAPVTEELLMRGFVLKNLSRVSQRFGIVMSAFLFGIWHENVAQFLLAFTGGLLFGYIAVKHDSLVPSIICHMIVNSAAELSMMFEDYGLEIGTYVVNIIYAVFMLVGIGVLIRMLIVERFPRATPHQSERGLRQVFASPLLLLVIIGHITAIVLTCVFSD
ncbi:MAG: CPBP family intramembrane metalloprotease [Oscillospiraceae bacterium]|nr:CPBP family intramembrane metalloprotease [Oscillospiraceae bacterium]